MAESIRVRPYAWKLYLVAVVAVLSSLYPAATIALARIFDHERCSRGQLAGLGPAAVSVGVLAVS